MRIRPAIYVLGAMFLGTLAWAQDAPKAELTFDYSFARYAPSASYTKGHSFNGGGGQIKFNIGPTFGIMMDLQGYNSNTTTFNVPANKDFPSGVHGTVSGNLFTYLFGPVIKVRAEKVHPYFDVLLGAAHSSVYGNAYQTLCQPVAGACSAKVAPNGNGFALSAGGGLDIPVNERVDFRVGQFDYLYTRFTNIFNDAGQNNFRYLTGLNIKIGLPNQTNPSVACAAEPSEVLPWAGPVRVSASPTDFHPKHTLAYGWHSSGGTADGQGPTATVDTTSLQPGQYNVTANVTDAKLKKNNTATCTASFTVKEPRPPVVACSASPATVKPGEAVQITVSGSSPDLSPIDKRSFWASSGSLKEGETKRGAQPGDFTTVALLDTSNATPGTLRVKVGVTDVHGTSSDCTATAEVVAPEVVPPPPAPTAQVVGKCDFSNPNRSARVSNECKAFLDGVALQMKQDSRVRMIAVGFADSEAAAKGKNLESLRAANVRNYLTKGDGKAQLDPSRIEIRKATDRNSGNMVQVYIVPPDASVQLENTETVDESTLVTKPTS